MKPPRPLSDPKFLPAFEGLLKAGKFAQAKSLMKKATDAETNPTVRQWMRQALPHQIGSAKREWAARERDRKAVRNPPSSGWPSERAKCRSCGQMFDRPKRESATKTCPACARGASKSIRTISGGLPGLGKRA